MINDFSTNTLSTKVSIVGTGTWGTTLAIVLGRQGIPVVLYARTEKEAEKLKSDRENKKFLPNIKFPEKVEIRSISHKISESEIIFMAVPAQQMRNNVLEISQFLKTGVTIVSASKGLEIDSCLRMSEVIVQSVPILNTGDVIALSGPNIAIEIAKGMPATTVIAGYDARKLLKVQKILSSSLLRVYTNSDIIGVELGGALKNIVALAAGITDGLSVGNNAEIARLGVASGANALTFTGLACLGDLITTCISPYSRNRFVGEQLGKGKKWTEISSSMNNVAEGVTTVIAACKLASQLKVDMPLSYIVRDILYNEKNVRDVPNELMARVQKDELYGLKNF